MKKSYLIIFLLICVNTTFSNEIEKNIKNIKENYPEIFKKMDLNSDKIVTIDEYNEYKKSQKSQKYRDLL